MNLSQLTDQIAALESALPLLNEKDRGFAESLISGKWGFKTKGTLSLPQVKWVSILLDRVTNPQAEKAVPKVGDFQKVYALFAAAQKKIKFAKIKLLVGDCPVVLAVSGAKSSQPGVVNITDGGPFGANKWFGRVLQDGSWQQGRPHPETAQVEVVLTKLAADPIKTAREYGKLTGCCCFCNKVLSDPQSVAAGFGETCAKNFGLGVAYKEAESLLEVA